MSLYKSESGINVWSLLFYLSSNDLKTKTLNTQEKLNIQWCDIEEIMRLSFQKEIHSSSIGLPVPVWSKVFKLDDENKKENIEWPLAVYMKVYYPEVNELNFYSFLLNQLKAFEENFGKFIDEQTNGRNMDKVNYLLFSLHCVKTNGIDDLSIDSFNYSDLGSHIFHINGDSSNPIFGIDSKGINTTDPAFPFTKTFQRLEQLEKSKREIVPFNNLVVYGHSLNEQDFNYFFPILDYLDVFNMNSKSLIIFAYTNYVLDGKTKEESQKIEMSKLCSGIAGLFAAYEDYKHSSNEHRLLDSLSYQRRVKIVNIDDNSELFIE